MADEPLMNVAARAKARSETRSQALYEEACRHIPGGVNSPVRAMRSVGRTHPLFIARAQGAWVEDADGNRYVDLVGSWGPMILGHADPGVLTILKETAARGTSFGAPTVLEIELASAVKDAMPSIELVRFVSSGTEAAMSAVRLARAATGRNKILKFAGCYHGHADALLVEAGSGLATLGIPASPGRAARDDRRHADRAVQRSRERARGDRALGRRARLRDRRARARQHGLRPARARLPRGPARGLRRLRRAAGVRRGHDRLPRRPRRRAGALLRSRPT